MLVMVTGATGFIGAALCRALIANGDDVIAFHRFNSKLDGIADLPIKRAIGDMTEPDTFHNALRYVPDAVVHLAARHISGASIQPLIDVNVTGARNLFQAAFRTGVRRVIVLSSAMTVGYTTCADERGRVIPISETHTAPIRVEAEPVIYSKRLLEDEMQWALAYGLDVVSLSPFQVVGPGDRYRRRLNFISRYAENPPPIWYDGGINLIDIDDVTDGIIAALDHGEKGQRYLLTGHNVSFRDLFKELAALTGVPAPTLKAPSDWMNRYFDLKVRAGNFFPSGGLDTDPHRLAGKYYYFDNSASRLALKLASPRPLRPSLRSAYDWFTGKQEQKRDES